MRDYRHVRFENLQACEPHRSDDDINRELDRDDLEWEIADIEDLNDVRTVLGKILALIPR